MVKSRKLQVRWTSNFAQELEALKSIAEDEESAYAYDKFLREIETELNKEILDETLHIMEN